MTSQSPPLPRIQPVSRGRPRRTEDFGQYDTPYNFPAGASYVAGICATSNMLAVVLVNVLFLTRALISALVGAPFYGQKPGLIFLLAVVQTFRTSYTNLYRLIAYILAYYAAELVKKRRDDTEQLDSLIQHKLPGNGPWLLPCKTTHARQFPKKHAFSYSYLQVAFQVGITGVSGHMLGIEKKDDDPFTWFSISAEDHLYRGKGDTDSLLGKLHAYLRFENVSADELENIYLVTAPRFLGYSFNPVSFWYLYDASMRLKYMILEVNNTFDERRMYLLDRKSTPDVKGTDITGPFRQKWAKDFHVSPFNSRKGSYSLIAQDPQFAGKTNPEVDNSITLRSSKEHGKLVARLFSTNPGIPIHTMTFSQKNRFILSWFWVGFMTFPRILKEAAKLFFLRNLHVWYRPEVLKESLGRTETAREAAIEPVFRHYLAARYRQSLAETRPGLRYTQPLGDQPRTMDLVWDGGWKWKEPDLESEWHGIHLRIHSPLFFAQIARLPSVVEKHATTPTLMQLFSVDEPYSVNDIHDILVPRQSYETVSDHLARASFRWRVLEGLRWIKYGDAAHAMDVFACSCANKYQSDAHEVDSSGHLSVAQLAAFRRAVTGLLVSDLLAFGSPEFLDAIVWLSTTLLSWMSIGLVQEALSQGQWSPWVIPAFAWLGGSVFLSMN